MFTIDFTKPWLYKNIVYFNQGNLSSNNILRCKIVTGGDATLEDYIGEVTFVTLSHREINGVCDIVDAKNCIVDIHFSSNALEVGENKLEIILTKNSKSGEVVAQSPTIKYEVWRGITTGNGIQSDNNYPILIDLIGKVNNAVRVANNASAIATVSLKQTSKMLEDVDNALTEANNTIEATNNAKDEAIKATEDTKKAIAAGTQDLEVKNARGGYTTLGERLDNLDKDLLKARDMTTIPVFTESNFIAVENTVDGYFEDIKLEGKTLVNMISKSESDVEWDDSSGALFTNKNNLKYLFVASDEITLVNTTSKSIRFGIRKISDNSYVKDIDVNANDTAKYILGADEWVRTIIGVSTNGWNSNNKDELVNVLAIKGNHTLNPPTKYFKGIKSVGESLNEINILSTSKDLKKVVRESVESAKVQLQISKLYKSCYVYNPLECEVRLAIVKSDNWVRDIVIPKNTLTSFSLNDEEYITNIVGYVSAGHNNVKSLYKVLLIEKYNKKKLLYYDTESQTWKKPVLKEWDSIEKHSNGKYCYHKRSEQRSYQTNDETDRNVITDKTNTVYKLEIEEVYECTPIDLITFENETNWTIYCGVISPKSTFKCFGFIGNVINTLKEKVSYLEDKLYKTNLANFTVALNTLDTKLKLEQLTKTPR